MSRKAAAFASIAILALATGIFLTCPTWADHESASIGKLNLQSIEAKPAQAGDKTTITFVIENDGGATVSLLGAAIGGAEPYRLVGFLGASHSGELGSLPIKPDETMRLTDHTAWIEVGPLRQDLVVGSSVPARLRFVGFEAPVTLHVSARRNAETIESLSRPHVSHAPGPEQKHC